MNLGESQKTRERPAGPLSREVSRGNNEDLGLIEEYKNQLAKALKHLDYSYNKVQKLPTIVNDLSEEELETWEGLSSRFARSSEIYLSRLLRAQVEEAEPGFRGSFRDQLNQAEKLRLIEDVDSWIKIRELRNREAHEYNEKTLGDFFELVRKLAPKLLELEKKL